MGEYHFPYIVWNGKFSSEDKSSSSSVEDTSQSAVSSKRSAMSSYNSTVSLKRWAFRHAISLSFLRTSVFWVSSYRHNCAEHSCFLDTASCLLKSLTFDVKFSAQSVHSSKSFRAALVTKVQKFNILSLQQSSRWKTHCIWFIAGILLEYISLDTKMLWGSGSCQALLL